MLQPEVEPELPRYPAKTYTQAYLDAVFLDVLDKHESQPTESLTGSVAPDRYSPNVADYRVARRQVVTPDGKVAFGVVLSWLAQYRAPDAVVEPFRMDIGVVTPSGAVALHTSSPSEVFLYEPRRPRHAEELMPPRGSITVAAERDIFAAEVLENARALTGAWPVRCQRALAALQAVAVRGDAPDWGDGAYRLRGADMNSLMDLLCNFWDVSDPRKQMPDWSEFWSNHGRGTQPLPDLNWRPYPGQDRHVSSAEKRVDYLRVSQTIVKAWHSLRLRRPK